MPQVPAVYRRALEEHRALVRRVVDRQGLRRMRRTYEAAIADLEGRLKAIPGAKRDAFTAHQYRLALGQLRQGLRQIARLLSGALGDITKTAQVEALRGLIGDVARLEKRFTGAELVLPIEEASKFDKVLRGVRKPMLREHQVTASRLGARLMGRLERQLAISLATGEDLGGMIDRVDRELGEGWYQAERIARTESSYAFGATQAAGIEEAAEEIDDLMMRWTEHVDDETMRPLDDRVSLDSIAMHGQVTRPGGLFTFPTSRPRGVPSTIRRIKTPGRPTSVETWVEVVGRFGGQEWPAPPNRPMDRASVQPVRPHWGVSGWIHKGGRAVPWP